MRILTLITALMFVACKQQSTMSIHDKEMLKLNEMFPNLSPPSEIKAASENEYQIMIADTVAKNGNYKIYEVSFSLDGTLTKVISATKDGVEDETDKYK